MDPRSRRVSRSIARRHPAPIARDPPGRPRGSAIYFLGLGAVDAVKYVKERRPIVDPIGGFPDLLSRLDLALRERR